MIMRVSGPEKYSRIENKGMLDSLAGFRCVACIYCMYQSISSQASDNLGHSGCVYLSWLCMQTQEMNEYVHSKLFQPNEFAFEKSISLTQSALRRK